MQEEQSPGIDAEADLRDAEQIILNSILVQHQWRSVLNEHVTET